MSLFGVCFDLGNFQKAKITCFQRRLQKEHQKFFICRNYGTRNKEFGSVWFLKSSGDFRGLIGDLICIVPKASSRPCRMALNVLDLTADLVDLTGDEVTTSTLVRNIDGVDMAVPSLPAPPKLLNTVKKTKEMKAKPPPMFQCAVCWENKQEKKRCTLVCKHDLCRKCANKMVRATSHHCPICRKKDAVFDGYFEI